MKLCTFELRTALGRHQRLGALTSYGLVDLHFACAWNLAEEGETQPHRVADALLPPNMLEFLRGGRRAMSQAADALEALEAARVTVGHNSETLVHEPRDVRLLAPLPNPTSFRDFYAFEQHVKKGFEKRQEPMPEEWYQMPVYYKGNHQSILGPGQDVHWPGFTEKLDYELELAVVIGKQGRNIPVERASEHIAGFTVLNDFSARDIQRREMRVRLGPAKGKDFATAIGPWLVTPDEVGDPYRLPMQARINGETWSSGNSSTLHWKFEQMIAFASQDETLYPGDLIGSGTVGTGCGLELDRWVKPGDVIELEIERLGVLRNRVVRP